MGKIICFIKFKQTWTLFR